MPNPVVWFLYFFFGSAALLNFVFILKPSPAIHFTMRFFRWYLRWVFGFESEIKATPRAMTICRIWSTAMFFWCLFLILLVRFTIK